MFLLKYSAMACMNLLFLDENVKYGLVFWDSEKNYITISSENNFGF